MVKKFDIILENEILSPIREKSQERPEWAQWGIYQRLSCPLNKTLIPYCPVAANRANISWYFRNITATDRGSATVTVLALGCFERRDAFSSSDIRPRDSSRLCCRFRAGNGEENHE